jgi:Zn-dependent protease with chaperone function
VIPKNLTGLRPQAYEHPSDAAALDALTNTGGFDVLLRKLNAWGFERVLRVYYTGSHLRVTADNYPELFGVLRTAVERLDLPESPDLYLRVAPTIEAVTAGVERPILILSTAAVDLLTDEELLFVLAREVGHIKSGHVLYHQLGDGLPVISRVVGATTLGLSELLTMGLEVALTYWKQTAAFTADRAGLLATQDVEVAFRTMMKIAGLPTKYYPHTNTEDFLQQAREFESMDGDRVIKLVKWAASSANPQPWMVVRAQQLLQWIDSKQYEEVLVAPQRLATKLPPGISGFCNQCARPLRGAEVFCPGCGQALKAVQA